ncbi:MAG: radical SAM protein [Candidatus Woesearchaeota archaeon]
MTAKTEKDHYVLHICSGTCKLRCVFCTKLQDDSLEEVERDIENELKILKKYCEKFIIKNITISGNDLLEYPHLIELIRKVKEIVANPSLNIFFLTHGIGMTWEMMSKIIDEGVHFFGFPLYAGSSRTHDEIVNYNGAFQYITNLLQEISNKHNLINNNLKLNISINSLILKQNQNELEQIINVLRRFNKIKIWFLIGLPSNSYESSLNNKKVLNSYPNLKHFQENLRQLILLGEYYHIPIELLKIPKCLFYRSYSDLKYMNFLYIQNLDIKNIYELSYLRDSRQKDEVKLFETYKTEKCKECLFFESCSGIYPIYYQLNLFEPRPIKS